MSTQVEIVLCTSCAGKGLKVWDECTNYHKREYDTFSATCPHCDGSGRIKKSTTVKYEAYKQPAPTN